VSPTPRAAIALGAVAVLTAVTAPWVGVALALILLGATLADAAVVRHAPEVERRVAPVLARGEGRPFALTVVRSSAGTVRLRQPVPPDLALEPREGAGGLDAPQTTAASASRRSSSTPTSPRPAASRSRSARVASATRVA
jgi:uncharacterized protein (DUF58 family)